MGIIKNWLFGVVVVPPDEHIDRLEVRLKAAMTISGQCRVRLNVLREKTISQPVVPPSFFEEMLAVENDYMAAMKEINLIKLQLQHPVDAVLNA